MTGNLAADFGGAKMILHMLNGRVPPPFPLRKAGPRI
jgi:hypothetical protein